MKIIRFTLSRDDYCRLQKDLHSGRKLKPPREKIEVQVSVDAAGYRYFRREQKRLRQLGEPFTTSEIMKNLIHSGIVEAVMAADRRERMA